MTRFDMRWLDRGPAMDNHAIGLYQPEADKEQERNATLSADDIGEETSDAGVNNDDIEVGSQYIIYIYTAINCACY